MEQNDQGLPSRPQLADDVATYVRDMIVSGQVRGGDFLRLENLADKLGISVTPVREALVLLRGEGFVVLQPRRGFMVAPFSKQDILDVYTVHSYLAGELAARACTHLDAESITSLHDVQAELEAAHKRSDAQEVERQNFKFHRTINNAAHSPKIAQLLLNATHYSPRLFFSEIPGWSEASADDHDAILAAINEGNAEKARTAMMQHITNAGALLADHLELQGMWEPELS